MNTQLFFRVFWQLEYLRYCPNDLAAGVWRSFQGYITCLMDAELIDTVQRDTLLDLSLNAFNQFNLRRPDRVPAPELNEVVESDSFQLQQVPARRELRLLCVLGNGSTNPASGKLLPCAALSTLPAPWRTPNIKWRLLMPYFTSKPRALSRVWPIRNFEGLFLRETFAHAPTTAVLERLQLHGQTNAFRPASGTLSIGATA